MTTQTGNLSNGERVASALFGLALWWFAARKGNGVIRATAAAGGASLFARAAAGHCAVKAAVSGHSTLTEGIKDQLHGLSRYGRTAAHGLPGSPTHHEKSRAVDEAVEDSFPASDPPASRLPDEPPSNAGAKWAAARAAGKL